jgi:hypothetical protein
MNLNIVLGISEDSRKRMKSIEIKKNHQKKLPPIILQNQDRLIEMNKNEKYDESKKIRKNNSIKANNNTGFLASLRHWRWNEIRLFDKKHLTNSL